MSSATHFPPKLPTWEAPPFELNFLEYYQLVRGQIDREAELISQRLSWLMAAESFLFIAFAASVAPHADMAYVRPELVTLRWLLPMLGIALAAAIGAALSGAVRVTQRLRAEHESNKLRFHRQDAWAVLPEIVGAKRWHVIGLLPAGVIPLAFITGWVCLLALRD